MCCSIRAAVFFLGSLHVYFAISQLVGILPSALSSIQNRSLEACLALLFALFFFSSGFMIFRGADEESGILVLLGGVVLFLILLERFILMYFDLLLNPTLPEGNFLNAYGTTVPIIFTVLLYIFYLAILFVYYNELKHTQGMDEEDDLGSGSGSKGQGQGDNEKEKAEAGINTSPRHLPGAPEAPAKMDVKLDFKPGLVGLGSNGNGVKGCSNA